MGLLLTLRLAVLAGTISALLGSAAPAHAAGSPTRFGIEYFLWHCLTQAYPVHDLSEVAAGRQQLGPAPQFHWWGKPEAGYYCLSKDDDLLRRHALLLAKAGIDFVFVDFSNHDTLAYEQARVEYLDPLDRMLAVWAQIPTAPKIVPFVPVTATGDLYQEIARRLEAHPDLLFRYQDKPLFLIVSNRRFPVDSAKHADLNRRFTTRLMWDDGSPAGDWAFISRCQKNFVGSRGTAACHQRATLHDDAVEQVSVSAAFQYDYMSDRATAAPRFHGLTFLRQMGRLDDFGDVPIVTILGWNQWIAQRICVRPDRSPDGACGPGSSPLVDGNPVFTDLYSQEYSSDFEPGGAAGDAYYRLLVCEVQRRKAGGRGTSRCALPPG